MKFDYGIDIFGSSGNFDATKRTLPRSCSNMKNLWSWISGSQILAARAIQIVWWTILLSAPIPRVLRGTGRYRSKLNFRHTSVKISMDVTRSVITQSFGNKRFHVVVKLTFPSRYPERSLFCIQRPMHQSMKFVVDLFWISTLKRYPYPTNSDTYDFDTPRKSFFLTMSHPKRMTWRAVLKFSESDLIDGVVLERYVIPNIFCDWVVILSFHSCPFTLCFFDSYGHDHDDERRSDIRFSRDLRIISVESAPRFLPRCATWTRR